MTKSIQIDLCNKDDFYEKYNKKTISKNLVNYIIEEAMYIDKKDNVEIIINDRCDLEEDCITTIKESLYLELQKNLRNRKLTNLKQLILLLIGIIFLFLSTVIKEGFIFKEVFLIVGWVPIWEVIDIELFHDVKEKRKRNVLKKLLTSDYKIIK